MSKTLKDRYLTGEKITQSRISMASTREQVHETIADTGCEIIYIDCQHGSHTEWDISRISQAAEEKGVPVLLRIKHTQHAYRLGNYCDLGVFAIKVPEVETEDVVDEAINSFYFPPIWQKKLGGMGRIWHREEKRPPGICQMVERERNPWIQGRGPQVSLEHTHAG